jgi:uncharacterized protein (DUF2267 family)
MDLTEVARAVADRTGLSREESADITRSVLDGLAVQVSAGEARHLATDLPEPLAAEVSAQPRRRTEAHPVGIDDFIRQMGTRTGQPERDARAGTAAVLATLRDTLSNDDYRHLMAQLPAGYSGLAAAVG